MQNTLFIPSDKKIQQPLQAWSAQNPPEEPGFFSKFGNSLAAIAEGVTRIPGG